MPKRFPIHWWGCVKWQTLNAPYELLGGLTWQVKHSCHAIEKDGDRCNMSPVDGNGHTPRGMEDDDGCARLRPSSSNGWFVSLGFGVLPKVEASLWRICSYFNVLNRCSAMLCPPQSFTLFHHIFSPSLLFHLWRFDLMVMAIWCWGLGFRVYDQLKNLIHNVPFFVH